MKEKEKVITLEDRIPKLKEQRRQKTNRRLTLYLSVFFLLILLVLYFLSPLSHVGKVTVTSNHFVDKQQIVSASGLSHQTSFWDVHAKTIQQNIKDIKEIKSVEVEKHFPNTVSINVTEYGRVAYLKTDGQYYPILENGMRLAAIKKGEIPEGAPILVDWPKGKHLNKMAAQLQKLSAPIVRQISEIYYTPTDLFPGAITLYMNDGFEVRALIRNFAQRMADYPEIISKINPQTKGIIRLRVGMSFQKYGSGEASSGDKKK
ncbi:MAG TPA: FtsQ-type POTRA domain-containing protein [Bacillales bacterium]|nr:FtsQ-type POTRA domain-containing protein [Bacillales bacterium]